MMAKLWEKARGAWEALLVAAGVALGVIAFFTWRTGKRTRPEPIPYPINGTERADKLAERILAEEYRREVERTTEDLAGADPHKSTADRWRRQQ